MNISIAEKQKPQTYSLFESMHTVMHKHTHAHKLRDRHLLKSLCVSKEKTFIALQLEIVCRCLEFKGGVELCEVCASCNISSDWIFEEKQAFSLAERG